MWKDKLPALDEVEFVALDTETTGLLPAAARMVEVAAVRFRGDGEVLGEMSSLIDPGEPIPAEARRVHGISNEMVAGAPKAAEILPLLLDFLARPGTVGAAHNAPFDLSFLALALLRAEIEPPLVPFLDTCLLAQSLLPKLGGYSLKRLTAHLGISAENHHRALADAHMVRLVLLRLFDYIDAAGFPDLPATVDVLTFEDSDISPASPPAGFEELALALEEGGDVEVVYAGGSKGRRPRRLRPLALYRQHGALYLAATCPPDTREKTFRLDRIRSLRRI